ncbi:MAG: UPF0262 family protein [Rhodospirillaceae bacterium]
MSHADAAPAKAQNQGRIVDIRLDEKTLVRRRAEVEHERSVAMFDILESNVFEVEALDGPYDVVLSVADNRLVFDITTHDQPGTGQSHNLPLSIFRTIVKDYFMICESYYSAIKTLSPSQIEAIDMGRRGLHDEGAELLTERLEGKITIDKSTARRLFTLICVLHIRG